MKKNKYLKNELFPDLNKLQIKINELFGDKVSNIKMSNTILSFNIDDYTYVISKDNFSSDNRHHLVCDEFDVFISDIWYLNKIISYLNFIAKKVY